MTRRPRWTPPTALAFAFAFMVACTQPGDPMASACVPGEFRACSCGLGRSGAQGCGPDRQYAACRCVETSADASFPDVAADGGSSRPDVGSPRVGDCGQGSPCDLDGDGVMGQQCGGPDCDDRDCRRFRGGVEVCDERGLDEDCDPCTVSGPRDGDRDGDGYVSIECRNVAAAAPACDLQRVRIDEQGGWITGRDCADGDSDRHPNQPEICNGVDDNCDGRVDEDSGGGPCGTGLPGACRGGTNECRMGLLACVPTVAVGARAEVCNGIDDDCDGSIDEGVLSTGEPCRVVGGPWLPADPCRAGRIACVTGRELCEHHGARAEVCNGADDDCDGQVDEAPEASDACASVAAETRCAAGRCEVVRCVRGHGDCDRDARNGCEVDLSGDLAHCGACGATCEGRCNGGWCDAGRQELVAGRAHTCAARGRGEVVCWGDNSAGQLGDGLGGSRVTSPNPTLARGVTDAVELGAGVGTLARSGTGRVWRWGGSALTAVDSGFADVVAISSDCVARSGGDLLCWSGSAFSVRAMLGNVRVLAGSATCVLQGTGVVQCRSALRPGAPWSVVPLPGAADGVCAGDGFACATTVDRRAWCWGSNANGQLGDGTTEDRAAPTGVLLRTVVSSIACGDAHACALQSDGQVWCWGANTSGQAGAVSAIFRVVPVPWQVQSLGSAARITCGGAHSCARLRDGRVFCWGANDAGQLGNGMFTSRSAPVLVGGP